MNSSPSSHSDVQSHDLDEIFDSLADSRRRRLLRFVLEQAPDPVSADELATALAARTGGKPPNDRQSEQRQQAAVTLHHSHLPKLIDAGLLASETDDTISLADSPAFRDPGICAILEETVSASKGSLDGLFRGIADGRRRRILNVLGHQFGTIHVETLARELLARDWDVRASTVSTADLEVELTHLRHADLPVLSDVGLVSYDRTARTVAYEGHPQLPEPWMHSVLQPGFRQSLTGETEPTGIGEIEGREQVISFGRSLCDQATEELFCMFTDTDLLEAGCLTRIRDASRRGVDVYLGTRDQVVRAYVREHAPDVVLWEPNTDWLNLPVAGDRVGRLLLADREAVMLGTLREKTTDGLHDEQSIIGEGEHNTLVTMICQLLGPHLEEVDKNTEDADVSLPL